MKWIPGYEGLYKVTKDGRVWSAPKKGSSTKGRWLKPSLLYCKERNRHQYLYVNLSKGGICKKRNIHRLVAEVFLKNPHHKPQVNHIDGDKLNNSAANLEWVDCHEHMLHSWRSGERSGLRHAG